MHYFKRNIGDYHKKAGRLTMLEHGAYTLLMDACYDRERFPTEDEALDWCWARSAEEVEAVRFVLSKFFTLQDGKYVQQRIEEEIEDFHQKSSTNRQIAIEREERRRTKRAQSVDQAAQGLHESPPNHKPLTSNQEPLTKNQEPRTSIEETSDSISVLAATPKARRRQQLPPDFYPNETGINAAGQKGINVAIELEKFRNYHQGKGSVMADWQAAWRTWVGNARPAMTQTRGKQLEPAWAEFYARSGSNVIDTEAKVIE